MRDAKMMQMKFIGFYGNTQPDKRVNKNKTMQNYVCGEFFLPGNFL